MARDLHLDTFGHPKKRAFLAAYAELGTVSGACRAAGIARQTHHNWLGDDPAYREAFIEAHETAVDALEAAARERALGWVEAGKRKYSDLMTIFLLKGNRPHKYRDNAPLPAQPAPDVARRLSSLSNDQLNELIDRVKAGELPPALPEPDDEA